MTYLVDRELTALLGELRIRGRHGDHPFEPNKQIQPCSIDLRVDNVFWRPSRRRHLWRRIVPGWDPKVDLRRGNVRDLDPRRDWRKIELGPAGTLTIKPGDVLMGRIYEELHIPERYAGKIEGRSSFARLGLSIHATGDFINPGWSGYMPLQLYNASEYPIVITPYLPLCQLMLIQLSGAPDQSYGQPELESKYINDDGGPSLWWRDRQVRKLHERLGELDVSEGLQQEIVDLVRFESADVAERFERYLDSERVGELGNAADLAKGFARREDWRKLRDNIFVGSVPVLAGASIGSLFAFDWTLLHIVLGALLGFSILAGWMGWTWRHFGYLGTRELRAAKNRPGGGST